MQQKAKTQSKLGAHNEGSEFVLFSGDLKPQV